MKKLLLFALLLVCSIGTATAQAQIKFDKTTHDFGKFSSETPIVKCTFTLTNTGDKPLVINQVVPSAGCVKVNYNKGQIQPGETSPLMVTYDGTGKAPGQFRKTITIRSNAKTDMLRLAIEGNMYEEPKE